MKKSLWIVFALLLALPCAAQNRQTDFEVSCRVCDALTGGNVLGVCAELLTADSAFVDSVVVNEVKYSDGQWCALKVKTSGNYIIRITHKDYETAYQNIKVRVRQKSHFVRAKDMYLRRKLKARRYELGEATVTASRVKFYYRGDTLVYDADAFNTAEGSMLDGLIKLLPGVELKSNGEITVNGRHVDELLLNGVEFFQGNNRIMLENLPAYMVKNVETYERQSDRNKATGTRMDRPIYTMNIKLKKQYSVGWIANAEVAGGTDDRYLARLFGLRFTKQSRLALFGNVNNVNETRDPGANGDWTPARMPQGETVTRTAGVEYSLKDKYRRGEYRGNVVLRSTEESMTERTNMVNFLAGGDTYGRSAEQVRERGISVDSKHNIKITPTHQYHSLSPYFSYAHNHRRLEGVSGTFSSEPDYPSHALLDSLRSPVVGDLLRRLAIHRTLTELYAKGDKYRAGTSYWGALRFPGWPDITLDANVDWHNEKSNTFDRYRLDFMQQSEASDLRHRYTAQKMHGVKADVDLSSTITIWNDDMVDCRKVLYLFPGMKFAVDDGHNDRLLYRLDRLGDTDSPLGTLPSADRLLDALDAGNSYESHRQVYTYTPYLKLESRYNDFGAKNDQAIDVRATLALDIASEQLDYFRAQNYSGERTYALFAPHLEIMYNPKRKRKGADPGYGNGPALRFEYNMKQAMPDLLFRFGIRDDVNPLLVTQGNAGLHRTTTHELSLQYAVSSYDDRTYACNYLYNANLKFVPTTNAVTMSSVYDRQTGVRTLTPRNIDGNWLMKGDFGLIHPLDKPKKLILSSTTEGSYYNSVDLIEVVGTEAAPRSTVKTLNLGQNIACQYRFSDKYSVMFRARGTYVNARSSREDFSDINAGDFDFSLSASLALPWNIRFTTDLTQYCRRGYADHEMNTNELVWNAALSTSVMQGNLAFRLDGFDILRQLSNVQRTINTQGRMERFHNTLPSYFMAHVIYRLNRQPKKK